jgi:hypothetical protein
MKPANLSKSPFMKPANLPKSPLIRAAVAERGTLKDRVLNLRKILGEDVASTIVANAKGNERRFITLAQELALLTKASENPSLIPSSIPKHNALNGAPVGVSDRFVAPKQGAEQRARDVEAANLINFYVETLANEIDRKAFAARFETALSQSRFHCTPAWVGIQHGRELSAREKEDFDRRVGVLKREISPPPSYISKRACCG